MGRDTNSLSVNTDINHKGIKTHQYTLFFCCSCKRHNHLQSDRHLIFWSRETTETPSTSEDKSTKMASSDRGAFALTSELQAEWEVCRTVICCDLGHDEGFDDDTGHWLACHSMLEWCTKLCSCAFCFCFISFDCLLFFSLFLVVCKSTCSAAFLPFF